MNRARLVAVARRQQPADLALYAIRAARSLPLDAFLVAPSYPFG